MELYVISNAKFRLLALCQEETDYRNAGNIIIADRLARRIRATVLELISALGTVERTEENEFSFRADFYDLNHIACLYKA